MTQRTTGAAGRGADARRMLDRGHAPGDPRERVLSGYGLPTTDQLLRGFPFLGGDLGRDARTFAADLLHEAEGREATEPLGELPAACQAMAGDPSLAAVRAVGTALKATELAGWSEDARSGVLRCWIYSVHLGDIDPLIPLALVSVTRAYRQDWARNADGEECLWNAMAWLTLYAGDVPELFPEPAPFSDIQNPTDRMNSVAADYRRRVGAHLLRDERREP